jgi:RNA:NAD 2'-phosphotransferase (TPT1/KptA family)
MSLTWAGKRLQTMFYGDDTGTWATESWQVATTWEVMASTSVTNEYKNLAVEGATEHHKGFRKALHEITSKYPELLAFVIKFDGPWISVRDFVGKVESKHAWEKITFYHGTSMKAWDRIQRGGLLPRAVTNVAPAYGVRSVGESRIEAVYLTTQLSMAKIASYAAAKGSSNPVVLEVKGIESQFVQADEDSRQTDPLVSLQRIGSIAYVSGIPASKIRLLLIDVGEGWEAAKVSHSPSLVVSRVVARYLQARNKQARTLYHGTIIDHAQSIRSYGLLPSVGAFVEEMYGGEGEVDELVFLADKKGIHSAFTAMVSQIGHKLGKSLHDVTDDDIKKYGLLAKIKEVEDTSFNHRPEEDDPHSYEEYPSTVEPGDYYSDDAVSVDEVLTGAALMRVLKKHGLVPRRGWFGVKVPQNSLRGRLMSLAIQAWEAQEGKRIPQHEKDTVLAKIQSLPDKQLKEYLNTYEEMLEKKVRQRFAARLWK